MQKSSQPPLVAGPMSGQVAPTVVGPEKDRTELYLALCVLAILGLSIGAYWLSSRPMEPESTGTTVSKREMTFSSPIQSAQADDKPRPAASSMERPTSPPTVSPEHDIKHADLYFEVGRKGLTDEAKAQLHMHAASLRSDPNWGVLLQGYTDQQGSADYNRKLGLRRAETVKEHLIGLGVPATAIKIVSLGKDGALCADTSDTCNRLNRRVHLEFRNIGAEHMVSPITRPMASSNQYERVETSGTPSSFSDQATESTPAETPGISPEISPTDESAAGQK